MSGLERSQYGLGNWERVCLADTLRICYRQAALNRWTATDKRWNRKAVSILFIYLCYINPRFIYLFIFIVPRCRLNTYGRRGVFDCRSDTR